MVKIRKKTSKRTTTRMREKVKHKVSEAHKKQKKHAKNDPTWKSKKPKELGIPNSFPYKDQVIAEQQAEKARVEAEKAARRDAAIAANKQGSTLASTAALAAALAADSAAREDALALGDSMDADDEETQVQDASLKLHAKSLRKVLEMSDVVIEVLDARDPVGTRCRAVERELKAMDGGRKKLVLVLNKIDLVPPAVLQAWLAHLRLQAPTIPFKSSTQQQRSHLSASSSSTPQSASGSSTKPLMELIKGFRLNHAAASSGDASSSSAPVKHSLTIGLVGHPNVGKSSLINTLKRSKACSVAPTPGWTKEVQEVVIEKGVRVLDCPGVVVEMRGEVEGALKGMIKAEAVSDPKAPIEAILARCSPTHLQMLYSIPYFNDTTSFLLAVARAKGRLRKGGVPDLDGTARSVLRDWVAGRIAYYTAPPTKDQTERLKAATSAEAEQVGTVSETDVGSVSLHTTFAPSFDLDALFGEADKVAFGEDGAGSSVGEMKAVKMKEGALGVESDDADVGWIVEDKPEEEEAMDADDDNLNLDDLVDDEADEDDAMEAEDEQPTPAPALPKGKRAAPSSTGNIVSVAPPAKKKRAVKSVSFSSTPLGPTGSTSAPAPSAAAANTKLFTSVEAEGDVSLNKKNKRQAKKDKKRAAKQTAKMDAEVGAATREFGEDAELPSKPREAQTVKAAGQVGGAYDFAEFFAVGDGAKTGGKKRKGAANDDDEDML
ncbi:nuclear GTP-binding protein [Rhodotorula toruloides]|uniref:Nuclear GTP-binding protein n=1 Tax=Rhodotorula toruloides TaxID=5286 RepID=A0A511KHD7_RHOTO|nr:nuclear GTP-binding protein [Rhodotorula toruloides]